MLSVVSKAPQVKNVAQSSSISQVNNARHIRLHGIPSTTTPGDIRRAISKKLQGVTDVSIEYKGFRPSGDAYLTLSRPEYMKANLRELRHFTLLGLPVSAKPQNLEVDRPPRSRGTKGRAEAVERGANFGNGLKGNFPNTERNVVIWGLPGKTDCRTVEEALREFKLAKSPKGLPTIMKVHMPDGKFSMYTRYMVTMASVSEAHRLVRRLHLKYWDQEGKYQLYARVLY